MSFISERVRGLKPSATLAIDAKAKALKEQGEDILNLSAGEPDFDTPEHIKKACIKALEEGFTKYVATQGILSLRKAICQRIKEDYGLDYSPEEVIVASGAKQAIFNLLLALVNPGDEVLILSPYWVSYPPMVEIAGGIPKIVSSSFENRFEPDLTDVEASISRRTKGMILNSPSNPTGLIYSREFYLGLSEIIKKHNLWVISDDIYDRLRFDGKGPENILTFAKELKDRVFLVNGVSKTYAMTGWRIGWAVGPKEVIKACSNLQGQSTSHATSFAQKGAEAALTGPQEPVKVMVEAFANRAKVLCQALREIPGLRFHEPQGAFYAFVDFSAYYGRKTEVGKEIQSSLDMADYLLDQAKVALVPGVAFGDDAFLRISFATSEKVIKLAVERIKTALEKLK
jgi:aspartate aminotransferase